MSPIPRPRRTCRNLAGTANKLAFTLMTSDLAAFAVGFILFIVTTAMLALIYSTPLTSDAAPVASPPMSDDDALHVSPAIIPVGVALIFALAFLLIVMQVLSFLKNAAQVVTYSPVPPEYHHRGPQPLHHADLGLTPPVIKTFPPVLSSAVNGHKIGKASVCPIDFDDEDKLRLIPNLAPQPAIHGTELPGVEVKVAVALPKGRPSETCPREGGGEQIQPPDLGDKNGSGSFGDRNGTHGKIRTFPRSHSTGHSQIQSDEDINHFTLSLSSDGRKQLMDRRPGHVLPLEGCSRESYRWGGDGHTRGRCYFWSPDRLDWAAMSEKWDFNSISPPMAEDGGKRSSVRFDRPFSA